MAHSNQRIILGSTSKWRADILRGAGIPFEVSSPDIDEKAIRSDDPRVLTYLIAAKKADVVAKRYKGQQVLIVCADQVAVFDGKIREKPADAREARAWLAGYRNKSVEVYTTVVVLGAKRGITDSATDRAAVSFGAYPDALIDRLIAKGDVLNSCGGFVHEDPQMAPFASCYRPKDRRGGKTPIDVVIRSGGDDDAATSVSGLPLKLTLSLLSRFGWKRPATAK